LHFAIKTQAEREGAAKFLAAVFCLLLAVCVALANYVIVSFSFELLLPVSETSAALAAAFVALKGGAGVLFHFFESRAARLAVAAALALSSGCGVTLAYKRALAVEEMSRAAALSDAASEEGGVTVNAALQGVLSRPEESPEPAVTPAAGPASTGAPLVEAINLVMDMFEVLCVYGAFHLSAKGVVWACCLPLQLPLWLGKEGLLLLHRTRLTRPISILTQASFEAPYVVLAATLRATLRLLRSVAGRALRVAAVLPAWQRDAPARWRMREIKTVRRAGALRRVRLREAHKTEGLAAALGHRRRASEQLHLTVLSALRDNLGRVEKLFASISTNLAGRAEAKAEMFCDARGDALAEEMADKARAEVFERPRGVEDWKRKQRELDDAWRKVAENSKTIALVLESLEGANYRRSRAG